MTTLLNCSRGVPGAPPVCEKKVIDSIYDNMPNKEDLIKRLAEMYNEPIEALIAEPEESKRELGNELVDSTPEGGGSSSSAAVSYTNILPTTAVLRRYWHDA